eukprot:scaffold86881_cov13-Tisochrysis_lutea.AAC.1
MSQYPHRAPGARAINPLQRSYLPAVMRMSQANPQRLRSSPATSQPTTAQPPTKHTLSNRSP